MPVDKDDLSPGDSNTIEEEPKKKLNIKGWVSKVATGLLIAVLAGSLLYYFWQYRPQKKSEQIAKLKLLSLTNEADSLLEKNMVEDALIIYNEVSKSISEKKEAELYGRVKNKQGVCYSELALISNKKDNLNKAIVAFQEALKVYTIKKYRPEYALVQNNLGIAYSGLSQVRDKEENLAKAISAYQEALKIFTYKKYRIEYAATQNNLGNAYSGLSKVREMGEYLAKAI